MIGRALLFCLAAVLLPLPALAGAEKAAMCVKCHGIDGNSTDATIPKLAGRHPDYIVRELKEFNIGHRQNSLMAPIVAELDAADYRAVAIFFGSQVPTSEPVRDAALAALGKTLYFRGDEPAGGQACARCHGERAEGSARFPRLAGQHPAYLAKQLHDFRSGFRKTARVMRDLSQALSDAEISALAEYLAGL